MSILTILNVGLALMGGCSSCSERASGLSLLRSNNGISAESNLVGKKQLTNFMMRLTCQVSSQVQPFDLRLKAT